MHPYFNILGRSVSAYGVMMFFGLLFCSALALPRVWRRGLSWEGGLIIETLAFVFAIIGAMVLYLFVSYSWAEIVDLFRSGRIWTGQYTGLVFYGGLIGSVPGMLLGAKIAGVRLRDYIPVMLPFVPLGHAFGRVGCFLGGCCYGRETHSHLGVIYTAPASNAPVGVPLLPVQLFESACLVVIFLILLGYTRKRRGALPVAALYAGLYGAVRFTLEFFRGDAIRGIYGGLSTSQWVSLALMAGALGFALWQRSNRRTARA